MAPKRSSRRGKSEAKEATIADGWMKSKFLESDIASLVDDCLLQSRAIIQWQSAEGHERPYERVTELVMFKAFVERGLAIPVCDFFARLAFPLGNSTTPSDSQFDSSSFYLRSSVRGFSWNLSAF